MHKFIPYSRHFIDNEDIAAVEKVLQSDWLTCGSVVDTFEKSLSTVINSKHVIACSNGTTALHLALLALGLNRGDKVIVPAITFLATANAVRYVNADVIFADVDPNTGLMTAETLRQSIEKENDLKSIKAVINVHLAGQCENLESIYELAKKYNLFIIEDAAHAIGSSYIDSQNVKHKIGSNQFCDLTTFSFHPVKNIATGEGGAVTTNNTEYARKIKCLRSHGMIKEPENWIDINQGFDQNDDINNWYYEMQLLGYNYRISDVNCALGISQLLKLNFFKEERAKLVSFYDDFFKNTPHIKPNIKLKHSDTAWHLYILKIDFTNINKTRTQLMQKLRDSGIGTQVHYIPLYRQPYYKVLYGDILASGAEKYYENCLSIPLYVGLTKEQQKYICKKISNL